MGEPSTNVFSRFAGKAVYVTSGAYDAVDQTISGSLQQISRVQDVSFSIPYPLRENTYLDSAVEAYNTTPPGVDVDIRILNTNGRSEVALGLGKTNASGTLLIGLDEEKDLYIASQATEGYDAIGAPAGARRTVLGLGQTVMTSYELAAQVGGLVESRISLNALTAVSYTGASGMTVPSIQYQDGSSRTGRFIIPAADIQYSPDATGFDALVNGATAISASDMILMFPTNSPFGVVYTGYQAVYLQSFNLALTMNRQEQKPLGYAYPIARQVIYPIQVDLNTQALVSRLQADRLDRLSCTTSGFSINLAVKQPCSNATMFGFYFNDLQVASQTFGGSIGPVDTVTTQWRGWIKTPEDLFFSPYVEYIVDTATTGAWGTTW